MQSPHGLALPPVYENIHLYTAHRTRLQSSDHCEKPLRTTKEISKSLCSYGSLMDSEQELDCNPAWSHVQGSYMSNPNIRLSSQQCRLLERTSREMTAIVNVQDRFIATLQGLLNTLPCSTPDEQTVLLRQSRASYWNPWRNVPRTSQVTRCSTLAFSLLHDATAFYSPSIRLSLRTSSVTCELRRSWPGISFALRLFRRHVQR